MGENEKRKKKTIKKKNSVPVPSFCLLCGEKLEQDSALRTSLYPEDGKKGRLMEIHGCSRCAPRKDFLEERGEISRKKCPVCGSALKMENALIARRYETPGKNQIKVLGCPKCFKPG